MIKKITAGLFLIVFLALPLAYAGAQVGIIPPMPIGGVLNPDFIVIRVLNFVWIIAIGIIVISFIVAGLLFVTAGGDPGKLDKARMAAIWGVAGVIVAILAFSITWIVGYLLTP